MYNYQYPMMNGFNDGWGIFMMLFWVIFLIIAAIVVFRLLKNHDVGHDRKMSITDIVKERFAKGDISKDEYEQLKRILK